MKRTISAMVGKGSITHNNRDFIAENVDGERTKNNITYCNEKIQDVYHELFDEALQKYNEKQTRSDRVIADYYEKIRTGKQEKPFHEIILQIGDKDTMGAETENGELAKKILDRYMHDFEKRNPNLRVFSAHLHMDEATPHLHIDFIPFTTNSKRGLETRVSLKKALEAQGFIGGSRSDTEWNQWVASEKEVLSQIMLEHGIEWDQKNTHEKHKTVSEFKKEKLAEEVEKLENKKDELKDQMKTYKNAEEYALVTVRKIKGDEDFVLKDPSPLMFAKTYKTKYVEPLIKKLLEIVKNFARRCYRAERAESKSAEVIANLTKENDNYKSRLWHLNLENSKLKTQLRDYDKIKSFLGVDRIKEILKIAGKSKSHNRSEFVK